MVNKTWFVDLGATETISLQNNEISSIANSTFDGLTGLRSLNISSNALTTLPEGIFVSLPRGIHINFAKNMWHCDCRLRWLQELLNAGYIKTTKTDDGTDGTVICQTPTTHAFKALRYIQPYDLGCQSGFSSTDDEESDGIDMKTLGIVLGCVGFVLIIICILLRIFCYLKYPRTCRLIVNT